MRRAIYTEAHTPLWLDTASALRTELDLEPVYWVGKAHVEPRVLERFPSAVFHSRTDAIRAAPAPALASMPQRPLDAELLRALSHELLMAGKMMDRLDVARGFRYEERVRLFQVQARYWSAVLDRFTPDLVLFPVQPHTVYHYILYVLCQHRGIPTSMMQWTLFHDWLYPLDHIDLGYGEIRERYRHLLESGRGDVVLPDRVEEYFRRVSGDYRGWVPDYLADQMPARLRDDVRDEERGQTGDFSLMATGSAAPAPAPAVAGEKPAPEFPPLRMFRDNPRRARKHLGRYLTHHLYQQRRRARARRASARRLMKQVARGAEHTVSATALARGFARAARLPRRGTNAIKRVYRHYVRMAFRAFIEGDLNRPLKEPGRSLEQSFRGRWGGVRLQYRRLQAARTRRTLLREYLARCGTLDRTVPYVFVALHYQPEQTTSPTGSVFVDQEVMVGMLAHLAPPGWRVYVKEHPFTFFPNSISERNRSVGFYDDLLVHPNVTLLPWSVSPLDLIDHAQAVVTVTGTTGLEAVMRGKPVLVFGYAWYRDCEGVFYTPDIASCRSAFERIAAGYVVDGRKVRVYMKAVEECSFRADLDFGVHIDPIPHEENVANVVRGIKRLYARGATTD